MAAGPSTCRYPGRAVGRQRNRGCNARGDCGIHFRRDDPGSAQWRHSDGCAVVFPAADSELLLPGSLSALAAVALPGAGGLAILTAAGVLPVSLAALAALALPGAGGLVILTAAGVRVGYRQAKAGFALRTAGIARFARPGAVPLGVVRSGSLVVVRPRALRVVRPGALSAGCLLDKVA